MSGIDPAQFGEWFSAYGRGLVLYLRQWVNPDEADDLAQDVFLSLARQRRAPEQVQAWLFRCARNAAISRVRSRIRRRHRERRAAAARPTWFTPDEGSKLDAREVQLQLESLDAMQREIVVMRIWGAMTFAEIADVMAVSQTTVFRTYREALAVLRERMESPCPASRTKEA